ncbi:hypothetical protein V8Z74_15425 [Comamonas sp. w2-DMI]|uniref:hypothetical protein n=1 Tax=Comamonas sp. w2-DMI TaxID=3126391 RepID=UPI0032E51A12
MVTLEKKLPQYFHTDRDGILLANDKSRYQQGAIMDTSKHHAYGVFKPVGHMVISFANASLADKGYEVLEKLHFGPSDIHRYTDREMLAQIDADLAKASPVASVGQELNLIKAHRALAERGYHWLVVRVGSDDHARQAAAALRTTGAERAQLYGRFIIEELIAHPTDLPQVRESPDSGLDAQTPSGREDERAELRPSRATSPRKETGS